MYARAAINLTFTFFNDDALVNEGAHIYVGDLDEERALMDYRIKMKYGEFWLYDGTPKEYGRKELLHGNFNGGFGFYSSSGTITGYNMTCEFGPSGFFYRKFKFVDGHTGQKYKWETDSWGNTSWKLKNSDGGVVATFKRSTYKMFKQGRLVIHMLNIPEHLLALILVTQKLVHTGVKARERQQRARINS